MSTTYRAYAVYGILIPEDKAIVPKTLHTPCPHKPDTPYCAICGLNQYVKVYEPIIEDHPVLRLFEIPDGYILGSVAAAATYAGTDYSPIPLSLHWQVGIIAALAELGFGEKSNLYVVITAN